MKCFGHPDHDAAAGCNICGRGLCAECAKAYTDVICELCFVRKNRQFLTRAYIELSITAAIFLGATILFAASGKHTLTPTRLWCASPQGMLCAFAFWGWKALSGRFYGPFIVSLPLWSIIIFLKIIISFVVGIIAGPWMIGKKFLQIYFIKRYSRR